MLNQRKFVAALATTCAAAWIIAAIRPWDRQAWFLENILLFSFAIALSFTYRRLQLSNTSYFFLAVFVILHIVGAHYTYAQMPLGNWAKEFFHFSRNNYDRFAHGAFGFLLVFPVRELILRFSSARLGWSSWLAAAVILGISGLFEILEGIVAEMVAPGKGVDWLAGQGDEWDTQNDMLSALVGSLLMIAGLALFERKKKD